LSAAAKETVVRRPGAGWSFTIPYGHEVNVDDVNRQVHLGTPQSGSLYELAGVEQTEDETIVLLGDKLGDHGPPSVGDVGTPPLGYWLPEIQDEFDRLRVRWQRAGFELQEFNAYAPGSTQEDQLRMIRRRLREVGG
jgi:hypothetical protein